MLTISENGYGKRTSSYEYRTTGRGGKGIVAMSVNNRNGKLVASFPVEDSDQIMLVTDKGQLIRCPVEGIRIAGRSTQGVIVFDTAEDEHVVSVEHIGEEAENGEPRRRPRPAQQHCWSAIRDSLDVMKLPIVAALLLTSAQALACDLTFGQPGEIGSH